MHEYFHMIFRAFAGLSALSPLQSPEFRNPWKISVVAFHEDESKRPAAVDAAIIPIACAQKGASYVGREK